MYERVPFLCDVEIKIDSLEWTRDYLSLLRFLLVKEPIDLYFWFLMAQLPLHVLVNSWHFLLLKLTNSYNLGHQMVSLA